LRGNRDDDCNNDPGPGARRVVGQQIQSRERSYRVALNSLNQPDDERLGGLRTFKTHRFNGF
jgi:hypothetical protein